ncbi:MAG: DUF1232 domain-containing protein [Solirubrobacteraceae bacterium]
MPDWIWITLAAAALLYVGFVLVLVAAGRRTDAGAWAGFIPDCVVLFKRLLADPRVPRARKILLALLLGYLAMPFDLVPDFIPVAGHLDDAIVVAAVLRMFLRGAGDAAVREHWPGPENGLRLILRLAGSPTR